jgi:hypothetical protein
MPRPQKHRVKRLAAAMALAALGFAACVPFWIEGTDTGHHSIVQV